MFVRVTGGHDGIKQNGRNSEMRGDGVKALNGGDVQLKSLVVEMEVRQTLLMSFT